MELALALILLLVSGVGSLAVMAYATRGNKVQPADTVPYVETPGDTRTEIDGWRDWVENRPTIIDAMADYERGGGCE